MSIQEDDTPLSELCAPVIDASAAITSAMDEGQLSQQSLEASNYGQDAPARESIDEILRRKRKAREYKVCS